MVETPAGMMEECIREGRPDNVGLTKRRVKLFEYKEKWNHARRLFIEMPLYFSGGNMIRLYNSKTLKVEDFKPQKYQSNNQKMLKIIEDFIDKV